MNKQALRTAVVTSLVIYFSTFLTGVLGTVLGFLFGFLGIISMERLWVVPLIPVLTSLLLGTVLALTAGRRFVRFVERINNALKQITKGNYDITLNEAPPARELREIIGNFNAMTQELKNTEILRNDFVQNVSHEFKTPLAAVEGYAALLQQPGLTEKSRIEYTDKIIAATRRLNGLSENILLLSRLEQQELPLERECFSLDEQIRECILMTEPIWNQKAQVLAVELEDCAFTGNKELLAHVWQNIFGNAVKFTPQNGSITVTLTQNQDRVSVCISDTGPGMNDETRKRAFEKFYQGDRSRSSPGSGLGLALAKRIVDLHGGDISINSQAGAGTVFCITLPCHFMDNA